MNLSVLFIIFNKTSETKKVFEVIRKQRPNKLFIAADGPREYKVGEADKCQDIRNWVLQNIDWECEINTFFRDQNVGCGRGPSDAISWFFEHVEEGIILEDDCLPNESFFAFCEEMLIKYRYNTTISAISGNNFQQYPMLLNEDYYYSIFPSSWGWATWRRAWKEFDFTISSWSKTKPSSFLPFLFREKEYQLWWQKQFDWMLVNKPQDMWDFQFHYLSMSRKQLAIIPKVNLVSNIGHGENGTHFHDPSSNLSNIPAYKIHFPLNHPVHVKRNYEADVVVQNMLFGRVESVSKFKRVKRIIKKLIRYKQ